MEELNRRYYLKFAAAYVRGKIQGEGRLFEQPLEHLSADEYAALFQLGKRGLLKLHRFKRSMELARVSKVLGILKGFQPTELLDIGTGRGVFLWPLLDTFPYLKVQCVDILPFRVEDLLAVKKGGIERLDAALLSVRDLPYEADSFDFVTALETLEHIPQTGQAFQHICRVARRGVILSVPSKEDENPEHIHLFDKQHIQEHFAQQGITKVKFDSVLNHIVAWGLK